MNFGNSLDQQLLVFWWMRQQKTVAALKNVYDIFDSTRAQIMQGYKEKLYVRRIIRKFSQALQKRGPTLEDRNMTSMRLATTACIPFMKDVCEQRSKNTLADFLKTTAMNFDIRQTFIKYHERVVKIQSAWSRMKSNSEFRIEKMGKLWDKESENMIIYCAKHKSKGKLKTLMKKLQVLDFNVKNKIIKYYVKCCRHEHAARVYEWIKHCHSDQQIEMASEDSLQFHISMVNAMKKFLFKGVDNSILDLEYKKEQKAIEKAQKVENKHGDGHGAKNKAATAPAKKPQSAVKKTESSKQSAKNKFTYKPLNEFFLKMNIPPGLLFEPEKQDIQMIIKKACSLKSGNDIDFDPMGTTQNLEL